MCSFPIDRYFFLRLRWAALVRHIWFMLECFLGCLFRGQSLSRTLADTFARKLCLASRQGYLLIPSYGPAQTLAAFFGSSLDARFFLALLRRLRVRSRLTGSLLPPPFLAKGVFWKSSPSPRVETSWRKRLACSESLSYSLLEHLSVPKTQDCGFEEILIMTPRGLLIVRHYLRFFFFFCECLTSRLKRA